MNSFTKEEYNKWLVNQENKELNRKMIEWCPFLMPRNRWTGEISVDFDYEYNEMVAMPLGWTRAFGYEMLTELRDALVAAECLNKYRITQIKEKFGSLRWYDFGAPEAAKDIIFKYCRKSEDYCVICGEPAPVTTEGWIQHLCDACAGIESCSTCSF